MVNDLYLDQICVILLVRLVHKNPMHILESGNQSHLYVETINLVSFNMELWYNVERKDVVL